MLGRCICVAALVIAGCATGPPPPPLSLEPQPDAAVWPRSGDAPRYAYVRTLIGEQDLVVENKTRETLGQVLAWVAGLIVGKRQYLELRRPVAGMTDDSGRIYVVDASHKAVIAFDLQARRVTRWPLAASGRDFVSPVAICDDGRGGILVTDAELKEVFRLDRQGRPIGRFGASQLRRPTGLACDRSTGLIYVADTVAHDIKVFDPAGALVKVIGQKGGEPGRFNYPTHLAFAGPDLLVSDTLNFRVQAIDAAGGGRLVFGELGLFVGNMTRPKGVTTGGDGRIYVVESYYDHVLVFDRDGRFLLPIRGTADDAGPFYLPSGIWTDAARRVYVADMFNGRIVVLKELTTEGRR